MTPLAAYLLLFVAVGVGFIFVHLVAGKLIRPSKPDAEKETIYECGEPTIGSAWIQFDVRFYVVALLFVIFDVEVAFFFPWAEVFGKANAIAAAKKPTTAAEYRAYAKTVLELAVPASSSDEQKANIERYERMSKLTDEEFQAVSDQQAAIRAKSMKDWTNADIKLVRMDGGLLRVNPTSEFEYNRDEARKLARMALYEILVFFGVLLVGFAYLWRRGDLAWVRSTEAESEAQKPRPRVVETPEVEVVEEVASV
jgi:NADH-quinone oxidoreductase subunit A